MIRNITRSHQPKEILKHKQQQQQQHQHQQQPPKHSTHILSNLRTFVTYSAVTAVCLQQLPFALSFSPVRVQVTTTPNRNQSQHQNQHQHQFYSSLSSDKSCTTSTSTSLCFNSRPTSNNNYNNNYNYPFLQIRGGASDSSKSFKLNMASSTETETAATTATTAVENEPKLTALRQKMKELDIDAFIIPTDDPHLSEYVPTAYMRRKFLTNFGGSAGTAVVTHDDALLWTDSRYVQYCTVHI